MAIKVTEDKENKKSTEYPCLKEYRGIIVLFTGEKRGCVVNKNQHWQLGYFHDDWEEDGYFTPYNGKITLENE